MKFEEYLSQADPEGWISRALTDKSRKNCNHDLKDCDTNFELATYGDALLKFALCEILLDECQELSKTKQKYESDKMLVKAIARHYDILKYIEKDDKDKKMPNNYDYKKKKHKYIATAVEAMLGAIYKVNGGNMKEIVAIVKEWKNLIDSKTES